MEFATLVDALSRPSVYPEATQSIEVRQTHLSVVFLTNSFAYKIKKPVKFDFVDASSLAQRRWFCEEEIRLNRRLAPSIYLGVVGVTRDSGHLRVEGGGEAVEWAVKMVRLPEEATLRRLLERRQISGDEIRSLARRIARFHAESEAAPRVSAFGTFDQIAKNIRDNLAESAGGLAQSISEKNHNRLRDLFEHHLAQLRPLIERRAATGMTRDGHGDLRLDHIYRFPENSAPTDWLIVDCVEFAERFRCCDPVADIAFLVMDLGYHGHRGLARAFAEEYFLASSDDEGRPLLPLYEAYRAAVRGKVEGLKSCEAEVPLTEQTDALQKAKGYWLFSLAQLEPPSRRPLLALVAGLPGAGKSTLARDLAERAGLRVIRADVVRKRLAGSPSSTATLGDQGEDIYSPNWNERTYAECLRQAEEGLFAGERVVVDASFRDAGNRRMFLEAAKRWGIPILILVCAADPGIIRARLETRKNDASDADWQVHQQLARQWEEFGPLERPFVREIATDSDRLTVVESALERLREIEVF